MKYIWNVIIALLIIALLIFAVSRFFATRDGGATDDGTVLDGSITILGEPSSDQLSLNIDQVVMPVDGYAVVRAVVDGSVGPIVGNSSFLKAGAHENVQVLMEMVGGQEYEVVLHRDNGNGIFDENDPPLTLEGGAHIRSTFSVSPVDGAGAKG
ncbi:MAG: hypothetical protein COU09_02355 [Candidatus Harrisonbacteria bacterium CG10_big_fil_rev_8_21_14_0_10_44_23]|uniref:DUF7282 domain-containing protein n=1 Tax=Candidatus Harrisonbacteria bacterium CG10_big_fil_rev_8_21_14_0_10_44_23 TaxID=1974585 RepID=A0A2H0UPS0_9BACT|nr:MAG: hypothetical protein COU09_02355 [Candidatus Harrisonbacteria bacterium CG10_big_fil_rev_8_21_14_0_10_44_23]